MIEYFCEFCNYKTNNQSHKKTQNKKHQKTKRVMKRVTQPPKFLIFPQNNSATAKSKKLQKCKNCFFVKNVIRISVGKISKRHQQRYCKNAEKITVIEIQENNSDTEKLKEKSKELLNEMENFLNKKLII